MKILLLDCGTLLINFKIVGRVPQSNKKNKRIGGKKMEFNFSFDGMELLYIKRGLSCYRKKTGIGAGENISILLEKIEKIEKKKEEMLKNLLEVVLKIQLTEISEAEFYEKRFFREEKKLVISDYEVMGMVVYRKFESPSMTPASFDERRGALWSNVGGEVSFYKAFCPTRIINAPPEISEIPEVMEKLKGNRIYSSPEIPTGRRKRKYPGSDKFVFF